MLLVHSIKAASEKTMNLFTGKRCEICCIINATNCSCLGDKKAEIITS